MIKASDHTDETTPAYEVTLIFHDNTTETLCISGVGALAELDRAYDGLVASCTVMFSGGECTVTASTCSAAQAGFEACACAIGHDHFCEQTTGGQTGPGTH